MKLIPVLELEPGTYSKIQRNTPKDGDVAVWTSYWKDSLSDSGIFDLDPIVTGGWFVELSQINCENLNIILEGELGDFDENCDIEESVSSLCGGYALVVNGSTTILPGCCGDLSNIDDWQRASEYIGESQQELWMGHPWLLVKGSEELIEIAQTAEYGEPPEPERITLRRSELKSAISCAKIELNEFTDRLMPIIAAHYGKKAKEICTHLVYGGNEP